VALFSYLHARKIAGRLILRVADAETGRFDVREKELLGALAWLGLTWDEGPDVGGLYGPYRQSERTVLYREAANQLLAKGKAYFCYCSPEELEAEARRAAAEGQARRYQDRCRAPEVRRELAKEGRSPVVRFLVPEGREIAFRDLVRREVTLHSDDLGDLAIYSRTDEHLATGHALGDLAAAVDDHAMHISCVLHSDGHLGNAARQTLLAQALGYELPQFGHLGPMAPAADEEGALRGDSVSIASLRQEGYLPEGILAYLATLGWAPGSASELLTLEQLVEQFDSRQLSGKPCAPDARRLLAANRRYLRTADAQRVRQLVRPRFEAAYGRWQNAEDTAHTPEAWLGILVGAAQEEAATLSEVVALAEFAFVERVIRLTPEAEEALGGEWVPEVLRTCRDTLTQGALATPQSANRHFQDLRHHFRDAAGLRGRQVMFPVRAALTGSLTGPCLGVVSSLLGLTRCVRRLEDALS
jgi:nondiscriminating glutamyl-tRNA synthetase